jgi:serine/threonine-protein kinase
MYAANTDAALGKLQKHEIALVIADVESSQEQLTSMLKLLKQEYPKILSIVTTKAHDAELVIELINQAQVFRVLNKPINVAMLKKHVHAALHRYLSYEQFPQLTQALKVEAPEQVRTSSVAVSILKRLGLMRGH